VADLVDILQLILGIRFLASGDIAVALGGRQDSESLRGELAADLRSEEQQDRLAAEA
jgi:hypothetical protein